MPRRQAEIVVPAPDRTTDAMIERCRAEVESPLKVLVRKLLLPYVRRRLGAVELGEGFQWGQKLTVGPGSRIGRFAYLGSGFNAHGPVSVGDLVMIAAGCSIVGSDHLFDLRETPTRLGWPTEPRKITVFGTDAWIGERVTILEGVTIGEGAVVGSSSTVTRDVPPYTIVAGVPARVIRHRFSDTDQILHDRAVRGSR